MSIFVTGCNGFLGRLLVSFYKQEMGQCCYGLGRASPENAPLFLLEKYSQDALPSPNVSKLIAELKPSLLIHAAGRSSVPLSVSNPLEDYQSGPPVVIQLLDSIRLHSPHTKFIFLSSAAVYGDPLVVPTGEDCPTMPISPYGYHKLQSELIVAEYASLYGIRATSVRIFSAYGPGLKKQFLWDFCNKAVAGRQHIELYGSGNETRDYIYGKDICRAINCIQQAAPLTGEQINICSGESVSISSLSRKLASALAVEIDISFSGSGLQGSPSFWQGQNTLLQSMGYVPSVGLEEGIVRYAQWYLANL
jgi:UDP-glucose 4-epimerase